MNIICEDGKNTIIIEVLQLGKGKWTLKFSICTTVGSVLFSLTLPFDLFWGQIEVR